MPTLAVPAQSMVVTQVHFAEVGLVNGLPVGILYVLLSIVSAALAFEVCRQATENLFNSYLSFQNPPRFLICST